MLCRPSFGLLDGPASGKINSPDKCLKPRKIPKICLFGKSEKKKTETVKTVS